MTRRALVLVARRDFGHTSNGIWCVGSYFPEPMFTLGPILQVVIVGEDGPARGHTVSQWPCLGSEHF